MPGEARHAGVRATHAYLLLVFTTLCFGMHANLGRLAVGEVSPMLLVSLRWLGTVALLFIFAGASIAGDWPALRHRLLFLSVMGILGFTVFNALFYLAAHTTSAINIGIIQGAVPVFILIGAFAAYRTRTRVLQVAGIAVTLVGVVIVVSGGEMERLLTLSFNMGDVLIVIACAFYSGYAVALRRCPAASPFALFTVFAGAAFLSSMPLALAESALGELQWPTVKGWVIIGVITVFPSFLAHICFIKSVAIIGPGRAGIFFNLVPIFAALFAVVFLDERFETFHGMALVLVLGGIALSEWRQGTGRSEAD